MKIDIARKPFVTWLIVTALAVTGMTWATYSGVAADAIAHDRFYIVTGIFAWYCVASAVAGIASLHLERDGDVTVTSDLASSFLWFTAGNLLNLGLVGTVYGFIAMLDSSFAGKNFSDPTSIPALLPIIGENWATALYATASGITFNVALSVQAFAVSSAIRAQRADTLKKLAENKT